MKFYGIKLNGKPLGWESYSNEGGEYCVATQFSLDKTSDIPWLVTCKDHAEKAMIESTAWYNASYTSPTNPYVGQALEVFEVEI